MWLGCGCSGERQHVGPASPWISLSASSDIAVLSPPCLCNSAALRMVLGEKGIMICAVGYGGEKGCQNLEGLVLQFGDACLVSICHLFSGHNTLLGLGKELWEAGKPHDESFVVPVKHTGLSRVGPCWAFLRLWRWDDLV